MQLVIQNSGVSEHNARPVFEAAQELGIETHCVGVIPFTYELTGHEEIDFSKPTFFYGSTRLLEIADRNYRSTGGVFINQDFDTTGLVPVSLEPKRNDVLNTCRGVHPLSRVFDSTNLPEFLKAYGDRKIIFVKPDTSLKLFPGLVINEKNWKDTLERTDVQAALSSSPKAEVCVSPYKEIWAEWRFFVVDGQVVTGSRYYSNGTLDVRAADPDILLIAEAATRKWMPLETCVMDLALTKDGLKVVEFNSVNSSGLYDCDPKKILKALQELIG
jgi:hypothetical protein